MTESERGIGKETENEKGMMDGTETESGTGTESGTVIGTETETDEQGERTVAHTTNQREVTFAFLSTSGAK